MNPDAYAQIRAATADHDDRPLIVCDVDEVVLEFIRPFMAFLNHNDHHLDTSSYRLTGNIRHRRTDQVADAGTVGGFLERFFAEQAEWQTLVDGAADALDRLESDYNLVLLTAMPAHHHGARRRLLDKLGVRHAMVAADHDKGPLLQALVKKQRPVAFVDDLPANHHSVARHAGNVARFHIMAFREFASGIPALPEGTHEAAEWNALEAALRRHFSSL